MRPRSVTIIAASLLLDGLPALALLIATIAQGGWFVTVPLLGLAVVPGLLRGRRWAHVAAIGLLVLKVLTLAPNALLLLVTGWGARIPWRVGPWTVPDVPGVIVVALTCAALGGSVWALLVLDSPCVRRHFGAPMGRAVSSGAPAG